MAQSLTQLETDLDAEMDLQHATDILLEEVIVVGHDIGRIRFSQRRVVA